MNQVETYALEALAATKRLAATVDDDAAEAKLTHLRDQNMAAIGDQLAGWGLDPRDPAVLQGAVAGMLLALQAAHEHDGVNLHISLASFPMVTDAVCAMLAAQLEEGRRR